MTTIPQSIQAVPMKKVSIIIPIYNVEKYVAECIDSVINQTCSHALIECILVDDCSPDKSMEIVRERIEKYQKQGGEMVFKMVRHEKNAGLSAARNTGIKHAMGEFLLFVDSDDYLYPESIATFMAYHKQYPDADILIGNHYEEGLQVLRFKFTGHKVVRDNNRLYAGTLCKWTAWNYCVRRSVVEEHQLRFEEGIYFEDNVFNYSLMSMVNYAVIFTERTYFYRKNEGGIIQKVSREKINKCVNDYLQIFHLMSERLQGRCFIGKSMKMFVLLMFFTDYLNRNASEVEGYEEKVKMLDVRKRGLIKSNLTHGHLFLFLFSLLLVNPFHRLTRFYAIRRCFDHLVSVFLFVSLMLNKILPFK